MSCVRFMYYVYIYIYIQIYISVYINDVQGLFGGDLHGVYACLGLEFS